MADPKDDLLARVDELTEMVRGRDVTISQMAMQIGSLEDQVATQRLRLEVAREVAPHAFTAEPSAPETLVVPEG